MTIMVIISSQREVEIYGTCSEHYTSLMFRSSDGPDSTHAGDLWGVRISALLIGLGAILTALVSVLILIVMFLDIKQHHVASFVKPLLLLLCFAALTYVLIRICTGLVAGYRFAQLGGIAWGVLLLMFCWMLVHDARGPYNPKAPDAQELDGPMFLLSAPTALWLIGYLSTKRVSAKFLGPRDQASPPTPAPPRS